jgi:hypothetical protein
LGLNRDCTLRHTPLISREVVEEESCDLDTDSSRSKVHCKSLVTGVCFGKKRWNDLFQKILVKSALQASQINMPNSQELAINHGKIERGKRHVKQS